MDVEVLSHKDFAMVIFQNVQETYPTDAHINCAYTMTSSMIPNSRDFVGLYKVGWMSTRDYHYYEWAPVPKNHEEGKETQSSILFPAHKMPDDDGEFYQFCYVTNNNAIRGASTPFQFKKPSANDFIELEDPENDMLVVRSKAVVLEERLSVLASEKMDLIKLKEDVTKERNELQAKLEGLQQKLLATEAANEEARQECMEKEETIQSLRLEAHDMHVVRNELQNQMDSVVSERSDLDGRINQLNYDIDSLQKKLNKLQREKDELDGENQSLRQQLDMVKNHCVSNEMSVEEYKSQIQGLKTNAEKYRQDIDSLESELARSRTLIQEQQNSSKTDKKNISLLNEQLKNTEDKLEAAENRKELLQDEISCLKETTAKLSADLATSEDKCLMYQLEMQELEKTKSKEIGQLMGQIDELSANLEKLKLEKHSADADMMTLQEQLSQSMEEKNSLSCKLEHSISRTDESFSSMHCLQLAQSQLKNRYTKLEKKYTDLCIDSNKKSKEHEMRVTELVRENEDLKERLNMAALEYKSLYIGNSKMQKKLEKYKAGKKLDAKNSDCSLSINMEPDVYEPPDIKAEEEKKLGSVEKGFETELTKLKDTIQKKQDKKKRYKEAFLEEKKRVDSLRKYYMEECEKKDQEIHRLRICVEQSTSKSESKIRNLEKFLSEKERIIAELEQELRDGKKTHDKPPGAPMGSNKPLNACGLPPLLYPHTNLPPSGPLRYPDEGLSQPLRPLPAPMLPERVGNANAYKLLRIFSEAKKDDLEEDRGNVEDERYEDAVGENYKPCPVCDEHFSIHVDQATFDNHVLSHVDRICPICNQMADGYSDEEFQKHVNEHLEQGQPEPPPQRKGDDDIHIIEFD